jgi:hypothetical protein
MFCPNQECPDRQATGEPGEYRAGVGECPYCGTRLVESLPEASSHTGGETPPASVPEEFEAVHETSDPSEIPILESILNGAGIPFMLEGMERFRAFSGGQSPFRFNPRGGTVVIVVPADRAEEARALLTEAEPE